MLAIVCALKKWRSDLLGSQLYVYTDHQTLENFDTQKDLSRRQARWMEHLLQFDMSIYYIWGKDNTVIDALSHLPADMVDEQLEDINVADSPLHWEWWQGPKSICSAVLSISADESFFTDVREGYKHDDFCQKLSMVCSGMPNICLINDL